MQYDFKHAQAEMIVHLYAFESGHAIKKAVLIMHRLIYVPFLCVCLVSLESLLSSFSIKYEAVLHLKNKNAISY